MTEYFSQGPTDNTCGFIALINALVYYNKKVPHKNELISLVKKYKLEYGTSQQDIDCLAYELGLYLSPIKNIKEQFISILEKNIPIITSARFKRFPVVKNNNKILDFNLPNIQTKSFYINPVDYSIFWYPHTCLITSYNKNDDTFSTKNNMIENYHFDDILFGLGPNNEQWDTTKFVTLEPIKITGIP
jgi:hypothetical protein